MSVKLHVGNISFDTTDQCLTDLFANVGSITICEIVRDRASGRSRGFGFVEMASNAESENAVAQLNGLEFDGRELTVAVAKPKQPHRLDEEHSDSKGAAYFSYSGRSSSN
jgi:RNA recognition motif-containing protein